MFIVPLIVALAIPFGGIYFGSLPDLPGNWMWLGALAAGMISVLALTGLQQRFRQRFFWIASISISMILTAAIVFLEQTMATYISGAWLLMSVLFIQLFTRSAPGSIGMATVAVMLFTAIALMLQPVPVSRVLLYLPGVAVPTHFALFADVESNPPAKSTYYQDTHLLSPMTVRLDTPHYIAPGVDMPWLRFAVMRDSNVIVERVRYQSLIGYIPFNILSQRYSQLHHLELSSLSHDVQLSKPDNGIVVDQIARGEEAWIKLPRWQDSAIQSRDRIKLVAGRLGLWLFICFSFLLFRPARTRES